MVSITDFRPILKRARHSYYLPAVTYGYFVYIFNQQTWLYLMLISGFIGTLMFVEDEILESIREDLKEEANNKGDNLSDEEIEDRFNKYNHATPWLYFETILLFGWVLSALYIDYLYLTDINWSQNFLLSALGFVNIIYLFGWVADKIYSVKYEREYLNSE
jgi:hypothetical protein